uniref:Uncharacterized protein n=1 Tax=Zea mays TaxID=4577 RepID=A0A804QIW7_MAIZE
MDPSPSALSKYPGRYLLTALRSASFVSVSSHLRLLPSHLTGRARELLCSRSTPMLPPSSPAITFLAARAFSLRRTPLTLLQPRRRHLRPPTLIPTAPSSSPPQPHLLTLGLPLRERAELCLSYARLCRAPSAPASPASLCRRRVLVAEHRHQRSFLNFGSACSSPSRRSGSGVLGRLAPSR